MCKRTTKEVNALLSDISKTARAIAEDPSHEDQELAWDIYQSIQVFRGKKYQSL